MKPRFPRPVLALLLVALGATASALPASAQDAIAITLIYAIACAISATPASPNSRG